MSVPWASALRRITAVRSLAVEKPGPTSPGDRLPNNGTHPLKAEVDGRLLSASPITRPLAQVEACTDGRFNAVSDVHDLMTSTEPKKKRGVGFLLRREK